MKPLPWILIGATAIALIVTVVLANHPGDKTSIALRNAGSPSPPASDVEIVEVQRTKNHEPPEQTFRLKQNRAHRLPCRVESRKGSRGSQQTKTQTAGSA